MTIARSPITPIIGAKGLVDASTTAPALMVAALTTCRVFSLASDSPTTISKSVTSNPRQGDSQGYKNDGQQPC